MEKRYYKLKCWIEVPEEEPTLYDNIDDAIIDHLQAQEMFPENKYEIVGCDKNGEEID